MLGGGGADGAAEAVSFVADPCGWADEPEPLCDGTSAVHRCGGGKADAAGVASLGIADASDFGQGFREAGRLANPRQRVLKDRTIECGVGQVSPNEEVVMFLDARSEEHTSELQ